MDKNLKKLIISQIQEGKNLENLELNYIENKLEQFFLREGSKRKKVELEFKNNVDKILKTKIFKEIVKEVRKEIGQVYGQFLTQDFKKREKFLKNCKTKEEALEILKLHKSTRERINHYEEIYKVIFDWYKPKYIVDLACGLNPISYQIIESQLKYSPNYFASDLGILDMDFLNLFFKKFKIKGIAKNYDITNLSILEDKNFQKADLVFLFKALDSFEEIKKNISKELLEKISVKNIVVSFPTKSLVSKALWKCFIDLYGSLGTAEIKFWFIDFHNGKGILRCAHTEVEKAKTAVLFMKDVDGIFVTPKILLVSGLLKKLKSS